MEPLKVGDKAYKMNYTKNGVKFVGVVRRVEEFGGYLYFGDFEPSRYGQPMERFLGWSTQTGSFEDVRQELFERCMAKAEKAKAAAARWEIKAERASKLEPKE